MLCPSVISRFGTLADKQRFDAASAMGQTRSWGHVGSMSGLPESGQGRAIYGRYGDARLTAACSPGILGACGLSLTFSTLGRT